MSNAENWAFFTGVILSAVMMWLKATSWPPLVKSIIVIIVAVGVGIGDNYVASTFTSDIFGDVLRVVIAAWASYQGLWKHVADALAARSVSNPTT